jgi:hypothetical protein
LSSNALVHRTCVICFFLSACTAEPARTSSAVIEDGASALPTADGMIVLDRSGDRALLGRPEPVAPNSDQDRVLVLSADDPALDGLRVLDARFAADAVVVLSAERVLSVHRQGLVAELDRQAEAPLSVDGSSVVYARGEMPFFEIARADVVSGVVSTITNGMAPAWSPAIDGDTIVFASSASGAPRLYRSVGGSVELIASARTPSSPIAPRLAGNQLTFEDEEGTTTIDLRTGAEVAR